LIDVPILSILIIPQQLLKAQLLLILLHVEPLPYHVLLSETLVLNMYPEVTFEPLLCITEQPQ